MILEHLADGSVTLTTVRLLAPHLTDANHLALLAEVRHRSKRDVEHIIARLQPRPDIAASVRKLPTPASPPQTTNAATRAHADEPSKPVTPQPEPPRVDLLRSAPVASPAPPQRPAVVVPIAPARYKVSFTVGAETYAKLRQVQDLLRHVVPDGDPAVIYDRALTALLTQLLKTKSPAPGRPTRREAMGPAPGKSGEALPRPDLKPRSRQIPVAVQRTVWQRDGGQCTFVSRSGRRCSARAWLEFHHTVPFAVGGEGVGRQRTVVVSRPQPATGRTRLRGVQRVACARMRANARRQPGRTRAGTSDDEAEVRREAARPLAP